MTRGYHGFKVGDRVRGRRTAGDDEVRGQLGTVHWADKDHGLGVCFDNHNPRFHCLMGGNTPEGHGWWCDHIDMELIDTSPLEKAVREYIDRELYGV